MYEDLWELRLVTRIETQNGADNRSAKPQRRVRYSRTSDCRCGQQLDMCAHAHCPRCGRSINRA